MISQTSPHSEQNTISQTNTGVPEDPEKTNQREARKEEAKDNRKKK